jgi:hypothetical protein
LNTADGRLNAAAARAENRSMAPFASRLVAGVRRHPHWSLAGLVGVLALPYAVLGVGWVLDDWFALRNVHFDGAVAAAGREQWLARPGQGAVYALTFGLIGAHPLAMYAVQVSLAAITAVLLFRLLRPFLGDGRALAGAGLWAVLPNHGSLVNWASAVGISVALVLLLGGCLLLISPTPRLATEAAAAALITASTLCYEAVAPAAVVAAILLPRLAERGWRWRQAALCGTGLAAAGAWMALHWHPAKRVVQVTADLAQLLPAHFGWGVAPGPVAAAVSLIGLAGLAVVLAHAMGVRGQRITAHDRLVLAGIVVILLGTAPFVRYYYAPLGAGDRANVVAGVGTALAWLGMAGMAWELRRPLARALTTVVVGAMVAGGVDAALAWHGVAQSGRRVLAALPPSAQATTIVVGPEPLLVRNVAAFLDRSNIEAAVQLHLDDTTVRARIAFTAEDLHSSPVESRIDLRCVRGTVDAARYACPASRPGGSNDPLAP